MSTEQNQQPEQTIQRPKLKWLPLEVSIKREKRKNAFFLSNTGNQKKKRTVLLTNIYMTNFIY